MKSGLAGLTVWITGASGGIGWAMAEAFAAEGARLLLHAGAREGALRERVEEAGPLFQRERVMVVAGDLREPAACEACVAAGIERFGRIDVGIVNAGIWPPEGLLLWQMPAARIREVMEVNLLGAIFTAQAFLKGLAATGARTDGRGANLVLIGSTAGRFGEAGHVEYAVTKAGLHGLMRTLKNEIVALDPYGRVNLIEPGWTVTPMARPALDREGVLGQVLATMPIRQLARPEDIARAGLFLASPALARHVSGEALTVAGGMEGRRLWQEEEIDAAAVLRRLAQDEGEDE
ncbi:MAG: SDR family oxidoreductase [Nannocystis sp.]|nr:SDR family oxidoreductase [Nannocystis sp.]